MQPMCYTPKRCVRCNCVLDAPIDQLLGVCEKPQCRGAHFAQKRQREEAAHRELRLEIAQKVFQQLRAGDQAVNGDWESVERSGNSLSTVPSCESGLCPLPSERVEQFAQHLDCIIAKAVALCGDLEAVCSLLVEYSHRDFRSADSPVIPVLNGCTTCRGYCCRAGGDTALLSPRLIAWQLLSDPTSSVESIRQAYLNRLPENSVEDSCVYHTAQGCALARHERENICNDFHCWELQSALQTYQPDVQRTWIAVAISGNQPQRIGIAVPGKPRTEQACKK